MFFVSFFFLSVLHRVLICATYLTSDVRKWSDSPQYHSVRFRQFEWVFTLHLRVSAALHVSAGGDPSRPRDWPGQRRALPPGSTFVPCTVAPPRALPCLHAAFPTGLPALGGQRPRFICLCIAGALRCVRVCKHTELNYSALQFRKRFTS